MSFLEIIDNLILDLKVEHEKVKKARTNKEYHVKFVSDRLNSRIAELLEGKQTDQVDILREVLGQVPSEIRASFDHVDLVESNVIATFNAYTKVKESYVTYENSVEDNPTIEEIPVKEIDTTIAQEVKEDIDVEDRKLRKIGDRPIHKLKERVEKNE